jgi:Domain of unknown function (DUF1906)
VIIDYSTFRPSIQELRNARVTAAGRYIGWDSVPGYKSVGKNITKAEADLLTGSGISVFLSFEYAAAAAMLGAAQGGKDGKLAGEQLAELGAPAGMTVYFAVDFDIPDFAAGSTDPRRGVRGRGQRLQAAVRGQPHRRGVAQMTSCSQPRGSYSANTAVTKSSCPAARVTDQSTTRAISGSDRPGWAQASRKLVIATPKGTP